jgi:hypothetical protein
MLRAITQNQLYVRKIVAQVKAAATHGTGAGQWSGRKAQLVAKKYKAAGGGYRD